MTKVLVRASSHNRPSFSSTIIGSTHMEFGNEATLRQLQFSPLSRETRT